MPRARRAALLVGALLVALAPVARAQSSDGTYTGRTTESPFPAETTRNQYGEVTITVANGALNGSLDFNADVDADFGANAQVIERVHVWSTWKGPVQPDGTFAVPGLSYSSFEIFSCQGDCSNVEAPSGNSDGFEITVTGTIADGVIEGALEWDGDPRYRFRVTNPELVAASQTTTTTTPTTAVTTTSLTIPDLDDPTAPGVHVVGDIVIINAPPGGVLEITDADLPEWARGIIARAGDMYVRVGPPSTLQGGDTSVLLNGLPIARTGDVTASGGVIVGGSSQIIVNGLPAAVIGSMVVDPTVSPRVPMIGGPIVSTTNCPNGTTTYAGRLVCAGAAVTTTASPSSAGDDRIEVSDDTIEVGDGVVIGSDPETMEAAIVVAEGSLVLDRALLNDHDQGEMVARIPAENVAEAFATGSGDGGGVPWFGIVALVAAVGLGARGFMLWRAGRGGAAR